MVGNLVVFVCGQGNSKCDYLSVGTYIPLYFSVMFSLIGIPCCQIWLNMFKISMTKKNIGFLCYWAKF